ncbi:sensor histidine kinase [Paenibacillus dendritiformis]|uniref:Integral membrane sensor signal transduction histidine kinase n=1 Tax=Paenibacillus dendritiformis C454 TaxID=1131935 RepID=H3SB91_9BACL|nr:sensor histidine kinase [Paenibacillus dendritiformis]EHQ63574.1 integral membrane sensor signal transduction histidine kinase [Paenibacillus dendritiformis C454]CAH8769884.1 sensor histidine kinase [Paenibacillus dendritiformis]
MARIPFLSRIPWPRRNLRVKLVGLFLGAAVLPLFTLGLLSYFKSSELLQEQFGRYGSNSVTQLQHQLDTELNHLQLMAGYIQSYLLNPARRVLYTEIPSTYGELKDQYELEDMLNALKTVKDRGIFIVTESGYFYGENTIDTKLLFAEPWWQAMPPDYNGEYWPGLYTSRHYKKADPEERLLGLVVPIRNQNGPLRNGRILLEMKADNLFALFSSFEKDTHAMLTITNGAGRTIYRTAGAEAAEPDDMIWKTKLASNDWMIEARMPHGQFYQSTDVIRSYTAIGFVLSVLLALLLGYLFSSTVTKRIKRLKESMLLAGSGRFGTRLPVRGEDELSVLAHSFNRMAGQLEELVEQITVKEKLKKEAELRAFHYQIHPHLLFNTLNSIQWKARLHGNEEIRRMLYHLTMVLEGGLDLAQELVAVRRELTVIGHFLEIQRLRYEHEFRYETDIDASLLDYVMPRMTLQPLFENIFFHAFEDGRGVIRLAIAEQGDDLVLTLSDDGKGMSEERRLALLGEAPDRRKKRGIGVYNVDRKFKLHFGPEYGLTVSSEPGRGTDMVLRWPKRQEENLHGTEDAD